MGGIKTFKDLQIWQKSHNLVLVIYRITKRFPNHEKYGLVSQMRRAAISIPLNIVEGFRRRSVKDSLNFYIISNGSLEELRYQLLLARDLKYINNQEYDKTCDLCEEVSKMLNSWIKSQTNV
jgi:four helix bundle protein